jgi:hypothetical protein
MINLKVLSTAAAVALALPLFVPSESFAQERPTFGGRAAAPLWHAQRGGAAEWLSLRRRGGGRSPTFGAAPARLSGAARPTFGGGGAFTRPTQRPRRCVRAAARRRWHGGYRGGYRHRGYGGGFIPGAVAGAVIGGALASSSYGYYGPSYGYYDDGYYDDGAVAVAPPAGDDSVAYCMQRYKSYDPASGTYLGYDGQRHPCP